MLDHDHGKYITAKEFNKVTADNFCTWLKQTNVVCKNNITDLVKKQTLMIN